jgi:hypothetical protein
LYSDLLVSKVNLIHRKKKRKTKTNGFLICI